MTSDIRISQLLKNFKNFYSVPITYPHMFLIIFLQEPLKIVAHCPNMNDYYKPWVI